MAVTQAQRAEAKARALRRCACLTDLDSDVLDDIVEDSACMINPDYWGKKTVAGVALLICHFGTRTQAAVDTAGATPPTAGPVASTTLDKISVSYAAAPMAADAASLATTTWGQQYLDMKKTILVPPVTGRVR